MNEISEHIHTRKSSTIVTALVIDEVKKWMMRCIDDGIITTADIDNVKIIPCKIHLGVEMVDIQTSKVLSRLTFSF